MELIEMAKKKTTPKEPTISNLPIPASDSPMVIDLPDGQKIVLGKLTQGAVIEVATWRGTGRPDSRTNRFMLGISDSTQPQIPQTPTTQEPSSKTKKLSMPLDFISRFVGRTFATISKALKRTQDLTPVEATTELEINAWLENLSREVQDEMNAPVKNKEVTTKYSQAKRKVGSNSATRKKSPVKKRAK